MWKPVDDETATRPEPEIPGVDWTNVWRGLVLCVGIGLLYVGNTSHGMAASIVGWLLLFLGAPLYFMMCGLAVFCLIGIFPDYISIEIGTYVIVGYLWIGTKIVWSVKEAMEERERQERNLRVQEDEERQRLEREKRAQRAEDRERAKFRNENKEILAGISELLSACSAPVIEILRAAYAVEGRDAEADPKAIAWIDIGRILVAFTQACSSGDAYIERLWFAVTDLIQPPELDGIVPPLSIVKTHGVKQLGMVMFLAEYDKQQGTTLSSKAASTYLSILSAVSNHCEGSLAAKIVADKYIELLRPYIHDSGREGNAGNTNASGSHSNRKPVCEKCVKGYQLLDLPFDTSEDEVKQKRNALAQVLHRDHTGGMNKRTRDTAEEQLKSINVAYEHILQCNA